MVYRSMCDYYLKAWYIGVAQRPAEQLKTQDPKKLENKPQRTIP